MAESAGAPRTTALRPTRCPCTRTPDHHRDRCPRSMDCPPRWSWRIPPGR